jgi:hypothetical protein
MARAGGRTDDDALAAHCSRQSKPTGLGSRDDDMYAVTQSPASSWNVKDIIAGGDTCTATTHTRAHTPMRSH